MLLVEVLRLWARTSTAVQDLSWKDSVSGFQGEAMIYKTCPECDGTGEDLTAWDNVCTQCEGSGVIQEEEGGSPHDVHGGNEI